MNDIDKFIILAGQRSSRLKYGGVKVYDNVGRCVLCGKVKLLSRKRANLCSRCYLWCSEHLRKKYGYYSKKDLPEAIEAYYAPRICPGCGVEVPVVNDKGEKIIKGNSLARCGKCQKIYEQAFSAYDKNKRSGKWGKKKNG